jgi:hypothetical protein
MVNHKGSQSFQIRYYEALILTTFSHLLQKSGSSLLADTGRCLNTTLLKIQLPNPVGSTQI